MVTDLRKRLPHLPGALDVDVHHDVPSRAPEPARSRSCSVP